jgi:hypothetical protein
MFDPYTGQPAEESKQPPIVETPDGVETVPPLPPTPDERLAKIYGDLNQQHLEIHSQLHALRAAVNGLISLLREASNG